MSVMQPNAPACRPRPSATGESIRCHEEIGLIRPSAPAIRKRKCQQRTDNHGAMMSENDDLIIYPVPSLVATLLNRERTKGSPLTEEEVIQIRDTCPAIAMPPDVARKVDESRGYLDIDPENCWEEWQRARLELAED
jgi:hypothetical protein